MKGCSYFNISQSHPSISCDEVIRKYIFSVEHHTENDDRTQRKSTQRIAVHQKGLVIGYNDARLFACIISQENNILLSWESLHTVHLKQSVSDPGPVDLAFHTHKSYAHHNFHTQSYFGPFQSSLQGETVIVNFSLRLS